MTTGRLRWKGALVPVYLCLFGNSFCFAGVSEVLHLYEPCPTTDCPTSRQEVVIFSWTTCSTGTSAWPEPSLPTGCFCAAVTAARRHLEVRTTIGCSGIPEMLRQPRNTVTCWGIPRTLWATRTLYDEQNPRKAVHPKAAAGWVGSRGAVGAWGAVGRQRCCGMRGQRGCCGTLGDPPGRCGSCWQGRAGPGRALLDGAAPAAAARARPAAPTAPTAPTAPPAGAARGRGDGRGLGPSTSPCAAARPVCKWAADSPGGARVALNV